MNNDELLQEFESWFLEKTGADKKVLKKINNKYVSDMMTGMLMAYVAGYRKANVGEVKLRFLPKK